MSSDDLERYRVIHKNAVVRHLEKKEWDARRNELIMHTKTSKEMLARGLTTIERLQATLAGKELQQSMEREDERHNLDLTGEVT